MAASVMASLNLKPSPFTVEKSSVRGLPTLSRRSFKIEASGVKKIKTDKPFGTGGGMNLRNGLDASGRKPRGKGVYQYVDKYGANVDGYSPIYNADEWSPSGDVYAGGKTGLLIWAVTLAGILAGGALLVYTYYSISIRKPAPFTVKKPSLPSLSRRSSFKVEASRSRKSKTDQPYGINGGMDLRGGLDASGRKGKGKGVYQFVDKYGANVDGYSPIYDPKDWSPSGEVYVGGTTGLLIWAVTLAGLLAGGALLVYNTSALVQ